MTGQDPKVCSACEAMQEKIYRLYEQADPAPPLHPNCRCEIEVMKSVIAGFGTNIVLFGRMTACFLLPMTITTHSMKSLKEESSNG
jgi:hypothetical protein